MGFLDKFMATFSYDHDENRVYAISQNDGGRFSVRLTVDELAAFLNSQNFAYKSSFLESAELMLMQGKMGQILDPMITKALEQKSKII